MSDYRNELIRSIELSLLSILEAETLNEVTNRIICVLSNYEITERCTDIIPFDDGNTRIIKRYAACLNIDGKSKKTIYAYTREIKKFSAFIGKPLPEVGVYDIRYYLATEKQRGVSDRSLENTRSYIAAFYQWMTNEELITKNPCLCIKPIKYLDKQRLPFSSIEMDKLRHACKIPRERALIEMLATSGVRVSELSGMNVEDIDLSTLAVIVHNGKGDKERTGSRSIFTPAAVDEYGNVTSRATVDVPRGCCFTVSVEYVSGVVDDPATTPTPIINVIDGSLSIARTA